MVPLPSLIWSVVLDCMLEGACQNGGPEGTISRLCYPRKLLLVQMLPLAHDPYSALFKKGVRTFAKLTGPGINQAAE
jgi:hypothetical protein